MLVAECGRCHTQYKLPLQYFEDGGRQVRCHNCSLEWFQSVTSAQEWPDRAPGQGSAAAGQAQAVLETEMHDAAEHRGGKDPVPPSILPENANKNKDSASFNQILVEVEKRPTARENITLPPLTMMAQEGGQMTPEGAFLDAKPAGLNPVSFGACVFFLMLFMSLIPAFLARYAVVHAMPSTAAFYKLLGFDIKAPGEGLKIAQLSAEMRTVASVPTLLISGHLSNMLAEARDLPLFEINLKIKDDAIAKTWKFRMERKSLGAGEDMPVSLSFTDMPKDGKSIELTVAED